MQRSYAYNGKGEQVRKYAGTANIYTLYDEAGHWLDDYDNTGTALQQAIWLDDLPVGLIASGNQLHYVEPDHLGTPRVVIEVARNVPVWTWDLKSEAFGNSVPAQDPDGDATPLVFDMRFPGQRYDAASGMNYNYFRDYDPGTGRYVESDPVGLRGGVSQYGYSNQSPLIYLDLTGETPAHAVRGAWWVGWRVGVGVGYLFEAVVGVTIGVAIYDALNDEGDRTLPQGATWTEARGKNDPVVLPPVNPGRDCDGNCNPCPPGVRWFVPNPGHGHQNGCWHVINYNQDPKTCMCYPDRPSRGLEGS